MHGTTLLCRQPLGYGAGSDDTSTQTDTATQLDHSKYSIFLCLHHFLECFRLGETRKKKLRN